MVRIVRNLAVAAVLFLALMPTNAALAEEPSNQGTTVTASVEQLEIIKEIYGKPITLAEYLDRVYPE